MSEHYCHECKHFKQDGIEDQRDRFGELWGSLCLHFREYAAEDDEACEWFEEV